jgi:hypothetical protein
MGPEMGPGQLDPNLEYDPSRGFKQKYRPPAGEASGDLMGESFMNRVMQEWDSMSPDEQQIWGNFEDYLALVEKVERDKGVMR